MLAARALPRMAQRGACPEVAKALEAARLDPSPAVRRSAAGALVRDAQWDGGGWRGSMP